MLKSNQSKKLSSAQAQPAVRIVLKSPYALRRNERNARTHSKKQVKQIANSIDRFGFTSPVLIDSDSVILAGHGRVEAAKLLKLKAIPVISIEHLSDAEKRALVLTDNKVALKAGWDHEILETELSELLNILPDEGMDVALTGFEIAEVDGLLLNSASDRRQVSDEEIPEIPAKPVTQLGDLWELGKHRVSCGDARLAETFRRLMQGKKAIMVFTDPPYNVPIGGNVAGHGRTKHREFVVGVGELSSADFREFLEIVMGHCAEHSVNGSIHYVCMDWRHTEELSVAGRAVYSTLKNICVWVKNNAGQGSFYRSQHELVFVFKNGDGQHLNTFELGQHGRTRTNVWNYAGVNTFRAGRMDELRMHPTVNPTALVADTIKDCSKRGSIVLDAFLGSGTTLVAAEQLGRIAHGIELDPAYVDVSIERWQKLTGRDAVLAGTSLTFDELRSDPALRLRSASPSRTKRRGTR